MIRQVNQRIAVIGAVTLIGMVALLSVLLVKSPSQVYGEMPTAERNLVTDEGMEAKATTSLTPSVYLPMVVNGFYLPSPLWRFGAAARPGAQGLSNYSASDLNRVRLGWYVDWRINSDAPRPNGIEYVPTVRIKQWKLDGGGEWTDSPCAGCPYVEPYTYTVQPNLTYVRNVVSSDPGMLWLIGNEIDRIDWQTAPGGGQDEIVPELYAEAYHDLYHLIKNIDPTARIAIGGVVQATPLRLQYLERVWDAYESKYGVSIPVDVWNIHAFVLQEKRGDWGADIPAGITDVDEGMLYSVKDNKDFSIAWEHIRAMRQWMKGHGQQEKPLIITEYGVLMPPHYAGFSYLEVRDSFMYPSFDHFLNQTDCNIGYVADSCRLVQRWNWYSLDDDSGQYDGEVYRQYLNGNLFYSGLGGEPQGLSQLGNYWVEYVAPLPDGANKPY